VVNARKTASGQMEEYIHTKQIEKMTRIQALLLTRMKQTKG